MNSTALTGEALRTYQVLGGNASAPNAPWSAIRGLLETLADVTIDPSGNLTAMRDGHVLTLHPALTKDIAESGEVNALRRFLRDLESAPAAAAARDPHLLLVIQGAGARLYRCQVLRGVPQLILPYEASAPNPEDRSAQPVRLPDPAPHPDGFFTALAEELQAAAHVVVFDAGSGEQAAAFVTWLSQHDRELSARILGTVCLREEGRDNAGLLAAARRFYATLGAAPSGRHTEP